MGFYDLPKSEREKLVQQIEQEVVGDLKSDKMESARRYASDNDTYVRKNTYLVLGRLYRDDEPLRSQILKTVNHLYEDKKENVRQTAVYAVGEIGKVDADKIIGLLEKALSDEHYSVRNAVIGSIKQMGEKNPGPALEFCKRFARHPDPKIRAEIIHGIELRGRTHPEDVLPILKELENDQDRRIKETIVHVLGQISYKKGCLEKVASGLATWNNEKLVNKGLIEILDVHKRYEKFSAKTHLEAKRYIEQQFSTSDSIPISGMGNT